MDWWLAYIGLGLFTGFSAGMLGIGGGLVMVPTLTMMFTAQAGFPAAEALHMALGTSMATILGVLPLAISNGAGSGSQNAVGIAVIGGMISNTILGIFFVPLFFVTVRRLFKK